MNFNNPFDQKITIKGNKKNVPKNPHIFSFAPIVFETKRQYVNELVKNQEQINHTHFSKDTKEKFKREELKRMQPVVARYTTRSNPFMPQETVFFTDKKISPGFLNTMARHENQHFAWEPFDSGRSKNLKSQGVKYCPYCKQRTPYDRYENREDAPVICLQCGKNINPIPDRTSKNMAFMRKTTIPVADYPQEYGYTGETVQMTPAEFLAEARREGRIRQLQQRRLSQKDVDRIASETQREYERQNINPETVEQIKPALKSKEEVVPSPWIEYDVKGGKPISHEGRHRATAARELGMQKIPVRITYRQTKEEQKAAQIAEQERRIKEREERYGA